MNTVYKALFLTFLIASLGAYAQSNPPIGSDVVVSLTASGSQTNTYSNGDGRVDTIINQINAQLQFHTSSPQPNGYFFDSTSANFTGTTSLNVTATETAPGISNTQNLMNKENYNEPNFAVDAQFFGPQIFTARGASLSGNAASLGLEPPTAGRDNPEVYDFYYDGTNQTLTVWIDLPEPFDQDDDGCIIPCTATVTGNGSSFSGVVQDASTHQPIPNAAVVIAGQSKTTDANGAFSVPYVAPGFVMVEITDPGYATYEKTEPLPPFTAVNVTFQMQPAVASITGHVYCSCDNSPAVAVTVTIGNSTTTYTATTDSTGSYAINGVVPGTYPLVSVVGPYYNISVSSITVPDQSAPIISDFTVTPQACTITPLRVSYNQSDKSPPANLNVPIMPLTDPNILGAPQYSVPLGSGVVADGVTPVLFMITGAPATYSINLSAGNATWANGPLSDALLFLQNGQWSPSTTVTITAGSAENTGTAFVYLEGLNWNDFKGVDPSDNIITATLSLNCNGNLNAQTSFAIAPVPIALVHGVAGTASSWTLQFRNALTQNVPEQFVQAITYGQGPGPWPHWWPSETDPMPALARNVDALLKTVELQWRSQWAFTRYDVVGQSQGGVLLRMLCQADASGSFSPFTSDAGLVVNAQNFNRGRFRRVLTIGSPHNGSLLAYYINQLVSLGVPIEQTVALVDIFALPCLQKFDPSQWQIQYINSGEWPVDSRIPFHCIQSTIANGSAPSLNAFQNPPIYDILFLQSPLPYDNDQSRGQLLIPQGSDGAVDLVSQGGGPETPSGEDFYNVSHCDPEWLFGVPNGNYETAYEGVGIDVNNLLRGSAFGPFVLPPPMTQNEKEIINSLIPSPPAILVALQAAVPLDDSTNIECSFTIPDDYPVLGSVEWQALLYNTNGIGTNGLEMTVNSNNPEAMILSVSRDVTGQVVVSAEYASTNGGMVFAPPLVVWSQPPSLGAVLTNINLVSSSIHLAIGDSMQPGLAGEYSDGSSSLLYGAGEAAYSSSNPQVATVDANGDVQAVARGSAAIRCVYKGLTAKAEVSVEAPVPPQLLLETVTNGIFAFSLLATPETTNVIQRSSDLVNWSTVTNLVPTNYLTRVQDSLRPGNVEAFYRVALQ